MFKNMNPDIIRNENFIIHCPKVKLIYNESLLFSGYGTIRKNKLLTYYVEFICLEDNYKNNHHKIDDFFIKLPKDPFNEKEKIHAEFTTTDGEVLVTSGFSIELSVIPLPHGTYRTIKFLIPFILYEEENPKGKENSLCYQFLEKISIPTNKVNSTTSTTGSGSMIKNESEIKLPNVDINILSEKDYTMVYANGDFEIEKTIDAINFYLAFSSGTLPQPYYLTYSTGNKKFVRLVSIDNRDVNKISSNPIPENFATNGKLTTDYSFNLLEKIINIKTSTPDIFSTIKTHWERVWQSTQNSSDICKLVLSVAIEGLLNDVYIPKFSPKFSDQNKADDIEKIKILISNLKIENKYKDRLHNSISYLNKWTSAKALETLIEHGILNNSDKTTWTKMRNSAAHPTRKAEGKNDNHLDVRICFDLFHKIILNIIGYQGPLICFGSAKKNETLYIEHKAIF